MTTEPRLSCALQEITASLAPTTAETIRSAQSMLQDVRAVTRRALRNDPTRTVLRCGKSHGLGAAICF
ncbi:MAG TPA: hypothetical protein VGJ20_06505 [Xanthobacteraceae bacterium]|jgi:hypothetical protein